MDRALSFAGGLIVILSYMVDDFYMDVFSYVDYMVDDFYVDVLSYVVVVLFSVYDFTEELHSLYCQSWKRQWSDLIYLLYPDGLGDLLELFLLYPHELGDLLEPFFDHRNDHNHLLHG